MPLRQIPIEFTLETIRTRELNILRREAVEAASREGATWSLDGDARYQLQIRPGVNVRATVCGPGKPFALITRDTGPRPEVLGDIKGRAAKKVLQALSSGRGGKAPAVASPTQGALAGPA